MREFQGGVIAAEEGNRGGSTRPLGVRDALHVARPPTSLTGRDSRSEVDVVDREFQPQRLPRLLADGAKVLCLTRLHDALKHPLRPSTKTGGSLTSSVLVQSWLRNEGAKKVALPRSVAASAMPSQRGAARAATTGGCLERHLTSSPPSARTSSQVARWYLEARTGPPRA
jgi:hypothetical protein